LTTFLRLFRVLTCCKYQLEQALLEAALHEGLPGRKAASMVAADASQEGWHQLLTHRFLAVITAARVGAITSPIGINTMSIHNTRAL
jgi:hypothetical protein